MEGTAAFTLARSERRVHEARPFLKWAGGKASLLPQLTPYFPRRFERYFEPFLGGGAVFFHLQPSRAIISDINPRLMNCYQVVRDQLDALLTRLEILRDTHSEAQYYRARQALNEEPHLDDVQLAALQIYLNKTCFNGLYRENRRGHFNVPMGRYQNPGIFCPSHLRAVSAALSRAELRCSPFEELLSTARAGDFIYLDPPYSPLTATSNFTSYSKQGFDDKDQEHLARVFRELDQRGCLVMQSNSTAPTIRELYRGFNIGHIEARRSINSKGRQRGPVGEVVIYNYRPSLTERPKRANPVLDHRSNNAGRLAAQ